MYFLTELEHKLLVNKLLPTAREVKVSPELRGWAWHQSPMKPYYDVKLPMYSVCSKYCPTARDIYVNQVLGVKPTLNFKVSLGKILHGVVSDSIQTFMRGENIEFEEWWSKIRWEGLVGDRRLFKARARDVWNFVTTLCRAKYAQASSQQPYASRQDLIASALPFLIEHKVSGELLGMSGILSPDCYDYLRCIMFDLKVGAQPEEWHRLYPVGYALVMESIYEIPIDICCVVYLNFVNGKISVRKDLFFASDNLRSWWIEERDKKMEIVALEKDPGLPKECPEDCMFLKYCRGE